MLRKKNIRAKSRGGISPKVGGEVIIHIPSSHKIKISFDNTLCVIQYVVMKHKKPKLPTWSEQAIQMHVATEAHRAGYFFHADTLGLIRSKQNGSKAKLSGAMKGWEDLVFLPGDGRVVWIELKKRLGGKVSPEQKAVHLWKSLNGYETHVVFASTGPDAWVQIKAIVEGEEDGDASFSSESFSSEYGKAVKKLWQEGKII